jgi:hypothetical protein
MISIIRSPRHFGTMEPLRKSSKTGKMRETRRTRTWKRCWCRKYCHYLYFCPSKVLSLLTLLHLGKNKALADVSALEEELKHTRVLKLANERQKVVFTRCTAAPQVSVFVLVYEWYSVYLLYCSSRRSRTSRRWKRSSRRRRFCAQCARSSRTHRPSYQTIQALRQESKPSSKALSS